MNRIITHINTMIVLICFLSINISLDGGKTFNKNTKKLTLAQCSAAQKELNKMTAIKRKKHDLNHVTRCSSEVHNINIYDEDGTPYQKTRARTKQKKSLKEIEKIWLEEGSAEI